MHGEPNILQKALLLLHTPTARFHWYGEYLCGRFLLCGYQGVGQALSCSSQNTLYANPEIPHPKDSPTPFASSHPWEKTSTMQNLTHFSSLPFLPSHRLEDLQGFVGII